MKLMENFQQAKRIGTVRALLIEDDPVFAELVRSLLMEVGWAEMLLEHAGTLADAQAALSQGGYDLIISDLNLPDSKGLETVRRLATAGERLIIVLTGEREDGLRESAISLGAYDLINKDRLGAQELERLVRLAYLQASALRIEEIEYRSIFENTIEGIYRVDAKGRVVMANTALARMLGYATPDEMKAGISDVAHQVYARHGDRRRFRALLESRESVSGFETEWRRRDGSTFWVSLSARRLPDPRTGELYHLGTAVDISARIAAEQDLNRFRVAMDQSADMILIVDRAAMCYVDVNSTACRLLGYSRAELLAMGPQDILPAAREQLEAVYDALIAQPEKAGGMNSEYVCKDGSRLPFESTRHVLNSGNRWFIAAISRDIRERLAAERALRESEERFRSLSQLSSDTYWEQDAEYRFVSITSAGDPSHLQALHTRLIGKTLEEIGVINLSPDQWRQHRATLEARQSFRDLEVCCVDRNGDWYWSSVTGEAFFDASGAFLGYRGLGKNISTRKSEQRLLALEHSIAHRISAEGTVRDAVRGALQSVCLSENWECGRYFQLDEAADAMSFHESWSTDSPHMRELVARSAGLKYRKGEGIVGSVWERAESIWVADVDADPRVARRGLAGEARVHGTLVFPVQSGERVIGVIAVSSSTVREPNTRLLQSLRLIGAQLGQFLQRKRAEAALGESERRFRQTFELAAVGMAQVSLDRRYLQVNRKLCEMLGYPEAELVGRTTREVSHPEDRDAADPGVEMLRRGEQDSFRIEKRYVRKDGSIVWMNLGVALLRDAEGVPQYEIAVYEDITGRRQREATLARFRMALDASADMMFLVQLDADSKVLDFNETACYCLGYTREELLGAPATVFLHGLTPEALRASQSALLGQADRSDFLVRHYRRKNGTTFEVEVLRRVIDSPDGRILVVNARDLTERRRSEERQATHLRLQESTARFGRSALARREAGELMEDAVKSVQEALLGGAVAYVEAAPGERQLVLRKIAGLPAGAHEANEVASYAGYPGIAPALDAGEFGIVEGTEAAALPFAWAAGFQCAAVVPVHAEEGVKGALCALGRTPASFGPDESKFLLAAASVLSTGLQRIDSERRLAFLAQFDALTGLPNRALLSDRFSQLIVQARRHGTQLGVLFIDLDDFKMVNDSLGHAGGDLLLKEAARRLLDAVRPGDTVARISGDEFAVILGDLARPEDGALVAQKIIDRLSAPVALLGQEAFVSASIGIAVFPSDGDDAEALLAAADAAMYRAKQSGRGTYEFFTADINNRTRARAQLGSDLRRALDRGEFALAYQPKFDLSTGRPCAVEALLRWNSPERGVVGPAEFIPVLEETGLIMQVGEWVLRRACEDIKGWRACGLSPVPVAVNLSARQFRQHDLDARIGALVREAQVDPRLIELEITESQLMQDPEHARRAMLALSELGIRIAIDDFGTGYSSLSYLTRFPVRALKIDRSFVADVLKDRADEAIVRTIIDMAHTLGFIVVAEGVETEAQAELLRALGCEQAQGYHFARPMPEARLRALLASFDETQGALSAAARYA